jgi:hypothetical protein
LIVAGQFAHAPRKGGAGGRAKLEASLAQNGPHHVLDRAHLVEHGAAGDQKRAPQPAFAALDVNLPEAVINASGSLGARISLTIRPVASTTQIAVSSSDTSSPA